VPIHRVRLFEENDSHIKLISLSQSYSRRQQKKQNVNGVVFSTCTLLAQPIRPSAVFEKHRFVPMVSFVFHYFV